MENFVPYIKFAELICLAVPGETVVPAKGHPFEENSDAAPKIISVGRISSD
jgi:hypothetical protein